MTVSAAGVPKEVRPFQGQRAGVATRVLASALDAVVLAVVLLGGYGVWAAAVFLWNPPAFHFPEPPRVLVLAAAYGVAVVYLAVAWRVAGRTYGDQVIGLRVLGRGGRPLGLVGAVLRAVVCVVFPIGLLWTAVSPRQRSVADIVCRTTVVYDWRTVH